MILFFSLLFSELCWEGSTGVGVATGSGTADMAPTSTSTAAPKSAAGSLKVGTVMGLIVIAAVMKISF